MSNSPTRVTSSEDSRERVLYGLMAFQRWAKSQNRNTPSALVEGLGEYGLEMSISNLDLGNSFHLVRWVRGDSSQAVQMFDFRVNEPDTIRVRYVKRTDNDRHTFNIRTGKVHSIKGNWMSGDRESQSVMETPRVASAYELLLEQWISPRNWCREGRFVIIRPKDLPTNDDDVVPKVRGVTLCKSAVGLLRNGYTLLLVKGDLIQIPLPKERRKASPSIPPKRPSLDVVGRHHNDPMILASSSPSGPTEGHNSLGYLRTMLTRPSPVNSLWVACMTGAITTCIGMCLVHGR
ncbi:expressed unknown protein [Seminavis robusta]|uniref:Uncharacterized protein n=1 Tax=Seminavis robusta TaxID=568900 RepID=A0A9N8HTI7_9STRA|nr:expressed unknown protein [Seminavis robusta]|eukprot:Sro1518_g279210.1 n/a (291) ;mRNA; r:6291-7163